MRLDDEKLLTAVARLSSNQDFTVFMEHFVVVQHDAAVKECVWNDDPAQAQGRAQALENIITTVNGAIKAARERLSGRANVSSL